MNRVWFTAPTATWTMPSRTGICLWVKFSFQTEHRFCYVYFCLFTRLLPLFIYFIHLTIQNNIHIPSSTFSRINKLITICVYRKQWDILTKLMRTNIPIYCKYFEFTSCLVEQSVWMIYLAKFICRLCEVFLNIDSKDFG